MAEKQYFCTRFCVRATYSLFFRGINQIFVVTSDSAYFFFVVHTNICCTFGLRLPFGHSPEATFAQLCEQQALCDTKSNKFDFFSPSLVYSKYLLYLCTQIV